MAKDKKNVTAWLDDEQQRKLDYIINSMGGNPSNSYVLSKLIEQEYERLTGDGGGEQDGFADIYKVIIAVSQGKAFSDMDSIKLFLKGGL